MKILRGGMILKKEGDKYKLQDGKKGLVLKEVKLELTKKELADILKENKIPFKQSEKKAELEEKVKRIDYSGSTSNIKAKPKPIEPLGTKPKPIEPLGTKLSQPLKPKPIEPLGTKLSQPLKSEPPPLLRQSSKPPLPRRKYQNPIVPLEPLQLFPNLIPKAIASPSSRPKTPKAIASPSSRPKAIASPSSRPKAIASPSSRPKFVQAEPSPDKTVKTKNIETQTDFADALKSRNVFEQLDELNKASKKITAIIRKARKSRLRPAQIEIIQKKQTGVNLAIEALKVAQIRKEKAKETEEAKTELSQKVVRGEITPEEEAGLLAKKMKEINDKAVRASESLRKAEEAKTKKQAENAKQLKAVANKEKAQSFGNQKQEEGFNLDLDKEIASLGPKTKRTDFAKKGIQDFLDEVIKNVSFEYNLQKSLEKTDARERVKIQRDKEMREGALRKIRINLGKLNPAKITETIKARKDIAKALKAEIDSREKDKAFIDKLVIDIIDKSLKKTEDDSIIKKIKADAQAQSDELERQRLELLDYQDQLNYEAEREARRKEELEDLQEKLRKAEARANTMRLQQEYKERARLLEEMEQEEVKKRNMKLLEIFDEFSGFLNLDEDLRPKFKELESEKRPLLALPSSFPESTITIEELPESTIEELPSRKRKSSAEAKPTPSRKRKSSAEAENIYVAPKYNKPLLTKNPKKIKREKEMIARAIKEAEAKARQKFIDQAKIIEERVRKEEEAAEIKRLKKAKIRAGVEALRKQREAERDLPPPPALKKESSAEKTINIEAEKQEKKLKSLKETISVAEEAKSPRTLKQQRSPEEIKAVKAKKAYMDRTLAAKAEREAVEAYLEKAQKEPVVSERELKRAEVISKVIKQRAPTKAEKATMEREQENLRQLQAEQGGLEELRRIALDTKRLEEEAKIAKENESKAQKFRREKASEKIAKFGTEVANRIKQKKKAIASLELKRIKFAKIDEIESKKTERQKTQDRGAERLEDIYMGREDKDFIKAAEKQKEEATKFREALAVQEAKRVEKAAEKQKEEATKIREALAVQEAKRVEKKAKPAPKGKLLTSVQGSMLLQRRELQRRNEEERAARAEPAKAEREKSRAAEEPQSQRDKELMKIDALIQRNKKLKSRTEKVPEAELDNLLKTVRMLPSQVLDYKEKETDDSLIVDFNKTWGRGEIDNAVDIANKGLRLKAEISPDTTL